MSVTDTSDTPGPPPAQKIVPATDAEGAALAKAMDVGLKRPGGKIDWDSPDHDKDVHRKSMVAKAKEYINAFRGCVLLGLDEAVDAQVDQPQGADPNVPVPQSPFDPQVWPVASAQVASAALGGAGAAEME